MEMSALKGCVVHSPVGCPVSGFDLIINRCERDSLRVHLILAKKRECAIVRGNYCPIVVPLVRAGCGRSFTSLVHIIWPTMELEWNLTVGMRVV